MTASLTPSARGRIKGAAFREFVAYYRATYGAELLAAHVRAMPERLAQDLDADDPALGVLTSQWYEAKVVHALLDEIARDKSESVLRELAAGGSRAVMRATLRGLYRMLFEWMATPERYARYAPKLWGSYYDSGEVTVALMPDGMGSTSVVRKWGSHHPLICELNRGAAVEIFTAMDCQGVECERVRCVSRGDADCYFVTRWTDVKR